MDNAATSQAEGDEEILTFNIPDEALERAAGRAEQQRFSSMLSGEADANDTYLRMTGYTREDLRAQSINWLNMTPPEYLARTQQARQELVVQRYGTPYEKEYICKDGSRLPVVVGVVEPSVVLEVMSRTPY